MDIGPIRRRFTAEPVSSPVPAEEAPRHEPAALEHETEPATDDAVPATRA